MNIRAVGLFFSFVVLAGVGVVACSSSATAAASGDCPAVGSKPCTNDAVTTQQEFDSCNSAKAEAKCGSKYGDVIKCAGANPSCGSDGKTNTLQVACGAELVAYENCLKGLKDGGAD
jgi:hypothetical protein